MNEQPVIDMDQCDYLSEIANSMNLEEDLFHDEIPEPIDQWSIEDFDQFAALIIDAE